MGKHNVTVSQLSGEAPSGKLTPYFNVRDRDYCWLGVHTNHHGGMLYLGRDKNCNVWLVHFYEQAVADEFMTEHPGFTWTKLEPTDG